MEEKLEKAIFKIREGKDESFKEFYELTVKYVYSIAYAYLLSREDAEDVVADTYLKLYSIRHRLDPSKQILAYIKKVTINYSLRLLNKRKKENKINNTTAYNNTSDSQYLEENTEFASLKKAISLLDTKDRATITLFYFDNASVKEISFILNESEGAIKTRLYRARQKLKEVIENEKE